jgi:hypothetical protein
MHQIKPIRRVTYLTAAVVAVAACATVVPAAAYELSLERGDTVVSSLQPEDFPPPPGAPISPLEMTAAGVAWPTQSERLGEKDGPTAEATCQFEFRASISSGGERYGRLSRIAMSYEPLENPRRIRYRWRLARGVERCKYRIYLGSGPSLTRVAPTYMDSRTGYYDYLLDEGRRYFQMIVWGRMAK